MEIAGRTALVTGAAGGIGFAIARALSEHGTTPILADIDATELARAGAAIAGARTLVLDVTDRAAWRTAGEAFGPIDILVNNAGIGPDGRDLADMDPDSFDRMIRLNLVSVFNGISAFAGAMRTRGAGHIVNTASMAGLMVNRTLGAYTAAKFGVVGMSEVLRAELAPHGIGVSVLCPGLVQTRLRETTIAAGSETPAGGLSETLVAMDAATVGQMTVDGIVHNRPLIVTHGEYRDHVAKRGARVLQAFEGVPASTGG